MASNQGFSGPNQDKNSKDKKKSQYRQKNYKSSPNLPINDNKPLLKVVASSKNTGKDQEGNKRNVNNENKKGKSSNPVDLESSQDWKLLRTNNPQSHISAHGLGKAQERPSNFRHNDGKNQGQRPHMSPNRFPTPTPGGPRQDSPIHPNRYPGPGGPRHGHPFDPNRFRGPDGPRYRPSFDPNRFPGSGGPRYRPSFDPNRFPGSGGPRYRPSCGTNRFPGPNDHTHGPHFDSNRFPGPNGHRHGPHFDSNRFPRPGDPRYPGFNPKTFQGSRFQHQINVRPQSVIQVNRLTNPIQMSQSPHTAMKNLAKPSIHGNKIKSHPHTNSIRIGTGNNSQDIKFKKKNNANVHTRKKKYKNATKECSLRKKITKCAPNLIDSVCNINVTPLLSFQKNSTIDENNLILMEFSDEDDFTPILQVDSAIADLIDISIEDSVAVPQFPAASESLNLIDLSLMNFADSQPRIAGSNASSSSDDSDSSYDSDESEITSEISVNSSIIDTESSFNMKKPFPSTKETFISVFWDIENCGMPTKKSVIDFASYIRKNFYEGRTEDEFAAACDVSRLSNVVVKELDEASVTIMHISSINKNAADKKIESCLQRFQHRYRNSNAAIVLISSDSDFTHVLHDMRYKHHIFINLICRNNTKHSLITEAHKHALFEDIMQSLPDRSVGIMQYILVITNLPNMKTKSIKNSLGLKLRSFNCRIVVLPNPFAAEIVFQDCSVSKEAMRFLQGFYLGGNLLSVSYQERQNDDVNLELKTKKIKKVAPQLSDSNVLLIDLSENVPPKSQISNESTSVKPATLCVFVCNHAGDLKYWKASLVNMLKSSDFTLELDNSGFESCLLLHFQSLKRAQKAKKIIQSNQKSDVSAPKFVRLLKNEDDVTQKMEVFNVTESNKQKIQDQIKIVQKKTASLLNKHNIVMNKMKLQSKSDVYGTSEAVAAKLIECNEQIETFKNFSTLTVESMNRLDCISENLEKNLEELRGDFVRECNSLSSALPIYAKKELILKKILENQVIVIRAETGSGKSTQLTQYMWRERHKFKDGKIICTQPRKIAAISLAKHVSTQVGSALGDIVGYHVGLTKKSSASTRILYMTDFTMLKVLVSEGLDNAACVIIDEAHERTIYTDILLGMIKKYLPLYPHLKVIITSATIDTTIFRDYFSLTDDMVLHIAGRAFPVEDMWLDLVGIDYFSKVIDTAFNVLSEELGDILCFLVTPLETEKAIESFNKKLKAKKDATKIKVYSLHGQLNAEEQQKVFEKTPEGMRKVIFATNCAETSITIPGIKYVIDCGMVKESQYDTLRNMNVLSTGFVSKSSAEQRRGRAGRTQVGKCYHLYSKETYDQMHNNTDPEILRINLGQALLKLMNMGISDPTQFDFVQSPPKELLNLTMEQLLHLKAVEENKQSLTELGRKMAILPLEPRLGHLIFQGFENNVEFETIAIAALLTMSSSIFFRNAENQEEADRKKRRFCEPENDYIMYLEVFKEWHSLPKKLKSQWCVTNCINARSMRIVNDLIHEILLILEKELGNSYKVNVKFGNISKDLLIKIIFNSYSKNLAVYSGHYKFGYKSLNVSESLIMHPASSICAFGRSTPQFVIYDSILQTSQTFILNICPISKDMVLDAIMLDHIKIDIDALDDLVATEFCMKPLGEKIIINNFIGKKGLKRKELVNKVKQMTMSDLVEIDINVDKGEVKIFGYGIGFDEIPNIVSPIVEDAQEKVLKEEKDIVLLENKSSFIGILTAGGCLKEVILPGEFRDIKVILKGETIESVTEKLLVHGPIKEIREWSKYFKITFQLPSSAQNALKLSNNEEGFFLQSIHKYVTNSKNCFFQVFMSFLRRKCTGVAYVTLSEPISAFLLPSTLLYKDINCRVSINKKSNDIQITALPPETDRKELEKVIVGLLPEGYMIKKFIVVRNKPYESNENEINFIKQKIVELFSEFTFKENIQVELKKTSSKDIIFNAIVYFQNCFDGQNAVQALRSRKNIPDFSGGIVLRPYMQTFLYCKPEIFSALKDDVEEALEFFKNDVSGDSTLNITAVPKGRDSIEVKITSNNVADLTDARRSIHTKLIGDELKFPDPVNNEKLFTESGKAFLKRLSFNFRDSYISQNVYTKTVTLFGKDSDCSTIKLLINDFLISMENDACKDINLRIESGRSALKELFKNYGYDLLKLKKECNISDIQINKYKQILTIQGNPAAVSKCEELVQVLKNTLDSHCEDALAEICPVCYDQVSDEKHRLELCGHAYCKECLYHLFQSSENFPLCCEYSTENNACGSPIVIVDIFWAINERKALQNPLFERFMRSFVESRSDICYCPSPDCPMIYRTTEMMNIYKCPACNNDICTQCQELYHTGITCSINQALKNNTLDSLTGWKMSDPLNRKACPSCSSPIEKNGGCNHMTCWKCKSHICWPCLRVFTSGDEVYAHLRHCPEIQLYV